MNKKYNLLVIFKFYDIYTLCGKYTKRSIFYPPHHDRFGRHSYECLFFVYPQTEAV